MSSIFVAFFMLKILFIFFYFDDMKSFLRRQERIGRQERQIQAERNKLPRVCAVLLVLLLYGVGPAAVYK